MMTLDFPNVSRSYDETRDLVRFWGYDRTIEVSFFVEAGALSKLDPRTRKQEAGYLETFDAAREQIYKAARKV
jgi:hypothetical protein